MTKKYTPKPSANTKESKPRKYLAYNMDILKAMVDRCDYLYAQKTADISRGLERDFTENKISLDLYQYYNDDIQKLVTKFGERCYCKKK